MTPYLEIGGDYREVAPGVFLIELPLPSSLGLVNVYLIRMEDGWMLVDTGMNTEASSEALDRAFEGLGVPWGDLRTVLLTHMHPDHIGLAPKVIQQSGARLLMHRADVELLRDVACGNYRERELQTLAGAGVPAALIAQITEALLEVKKSFHPLRPDVELEGGERLGPFEVIWTPGHSPGHVCLYDRERKLLFAGDHILEHITPNIGWQQDRSALAEYLHSLDRVAALDVDLIFPSHGAPFNGHRGWVRQTHDHHAQRCAEIRNAIGAGARNAHEITRHVWKRELSPFHHRFAVFEVLAHLEYMGVSGTSVPLSH